MSKDEIRKLVELAYNEGFVDGNINALDKKKQYTDQSFKRSGILKLLHIRLGRDYE